jgi:lambda repressor-like predicted transcriptional regulator
VNNQLTDTTNKSLRYAYSKYKAIVAAIQCYYEIIPEGRWPEQYQKVTVTEIQQIFVSKSV